MIESVFTFLSARETLHQLSIPVIAALIGWSTNWLAIKLTFYPVRFVGIAPWFGWQGIVPRKCKKMAEKLVDNTLTRISNVRDLYQEIDPQRIENHLRDHLERHLDDYIDELMQLHHPTIWENIPALVRKKILSDARRQLPTTIHALMQEIEIRIDELIDIRSLVCKELANDKTLLIRVFQECGQEEFKFIIRSGAYLGFLFGLIQLLIWQHFAHPWLLPLCGFFVGTVTNWIALNIIFKPLKPFKLGPVTLQGLFLQRQVDVSKTFSHIMAHELLNTRIFVEALFYGAYGQTTHALTHKHLRNALDKNLTLRTFAQLSLGFQGYRQIKDHATRHALQISLTTLEDSKFNQERADTVEKMMTLRMSGLSSEEFQDLLRPIFSEEEWILVAMGGCLGICAGLLQLVFLGQI